MFFSFFLSFLGEMKPVIVTQIQDRETTFMNFICKPMKVRRPFPSVRKKNICLEQNFCLWLKKHFSFWPTPYVSCGLP